MQEVGVNGALILSGLSSFNAGVTVGSQILRRKQSKSFAVRTLPSVGGGAFAELNRLPQCK